MKICVTAAGSTLGASVDPRVGRAAYFIIVDSETMTFEAVSNTVARRNQSFLTSSSVWTFAFKRSNITISFVKHAR